MENLNEFYEIIEDLLGNPLVMNMNTMNQHSKSVTLLEHSIYTAYVTYRICNFFHLNTKDAVRAAVLHDFRLKDTEEKDRLFTHSGVALEEANKYFELTDMQKNIIKSHMWPVTPFLLPKSIEAWVVDIADDYCAISECLHIFQNSKIQGWIEQYA